MSADDRWVHKTASSIVRRVFSSPQTTAYETVEMELRTFAAVLKRHEAARSDIRSAAEEMADSENTRPESAPRVSAADVAAITARAEAAEAMLEMAEEELRVIADYPSPHHDWPSDWMKTRASVALSNLVAVRRKGAVKGREPGQEEGLSYHDLYITTERIPRTSISDLPHSLMVLCTRAGGWELWERYDRHERPLAQEYCGEGGNWLVLDVAGAVIVDSRPAAAPWPET